MRRNLYLNNTPLEEALDKYTKAINEVFKHQYETIPVVEALHRVTKDAIYAKYNSPLFNASAMDGIAVTAKKTNGATELTPMELKLGEDYQIVDTGDPIKSPYDAVIMAEDVVELEEGKVKIFAAAASWQHIRPIGEDIVAGELIIPSLREIKPVDIGVLLSAGILEIEVYKKPTVAIFPTGTEIIEPSDTPVEGSIIESNSRMFEGLVTEIGGKPTRFPPIKDDYEEIKSHIKDAVDKYDMVIVNAGSSAGTEDYTVHILRELGEVIIHGVAVKPGKPVILALVNGKPVIGLPGYPVSAYIAFDKFVTPIVNLLAGSKQTPPETVQAVSSTRMVSSLKHREYVRVKVGNVNGKFVASPLSRGAGAAMSLVRADGFCTILQEQEGVEAGELVTVELTHSKSEIENTLVLIGSHDLILDLTADDMIRSKENVSLTSTHVGSMGGLMALRREEAHLAPIHLLDEQTGIYNQSYVKRLFKEPMAIIKGVRRIQGIIVKKGNPLNIEKVEDLTKCRFVNRQRGAGTRLLFDYKLKVNNISSESIDGYTHEVTTHMAVAALVASDSVDAGMGILSAATQMNLDFIPLGEEEYDFAVPVKFLELGIVKAFIARLKSEEWRQKVIALGGYSCVESGEVIYIES